MQDRLVFGLGFETELLVSVRPGYRGERCHQGPTHPALLHPVEDRHRELDTATVLGDDVTADTGDVIVDGGAPGDVVSLVDVAEVLELPVGERRPP